MPGILHGLADVLGTLLRLYFYCVVIAVVLQWVQADPYNPIVRFFRQITEPVLAWIRRRLPFVVIGAIDLSPLVVWLLIMFLQEALVGNLHRLAQSWVFMPVIGFLFAGPGAASAQMGRDLYNKVLSVRNSMDKADKAFASEGFKVTKACFGDS